MKTADNYSSYQLDRLVQEIEGRLNDYEDGASEKDETIKSFAFFVGECAKNAVNNALADYKQSIIELIEDIQTTELLRGWKHTSDILEELIAKIKKVK